MSFFIPGHLNFVLDVSAGSSGKGKVSSYLVKHSGQMLLGECDFLITSNSPNASHRVVDGEKDIVFKNLPSGSLYHEKLKAVYIVSGAIIDLDSLEKEVALIGLPKEKLFIHPRAGVVQQIDIDYEKGLCDLNGVYTETRGAGTLKTGTTASGSGAVLARKVLRHPLTKVVEDYRERIEKIATIAPVEVLILGRLMKGESGLYEIGQGFPLSNNHHLFAPHTTSRNVTISAALNDAMLPPAVAGRVVLNTRTHPIRINSKKFIGKDGKHLTWEDVKAGIEHEVVESFSGHWYPDQTEITWEQVEADAGITIPEVVKNTTLTKLPRRIATFSKQGLNEALMYNATHHQPVISVNFANFIDGELYNTRDPQKIQNSEKFLEWLHTNVLSSGFVREANPLFIIGTGEETDATVILNGV